MRTLLLLALLGCDSSGDGASRRSLAAAASAPAGGAPDSEADGAEGDDPRPVDGAVAPDMAWVADVAVPVGGDAAPAADVAVPPPPEDPCLASVVRVGDTEVFAYEASRPDATDLEAGEDEARACSVAGVVPWSGMTLAVASAACVASGFELCSGEDWFRACAGDDPDDERDFPYGDDYVARRCNDHISGGGALELRGVREMCRSPEGVYDLSGNLWELVSDLERRGASWKLGAATFRLDAARCHARFLVPPEFWAVDLGFRCCRDASGL